MDNRGHSKKNHTPFSEEFLVELDQVVVVTLVVGSFFFLFSSYINFFNSFSLFFGYTLFFLFVPLHTTLSLRKICFDYSPDAQVGRLISFWLSLGFTFSWWNFLFLSFF